MFLNKSLWSKGGMLKNVNIYNITSVQEVLSFVDVSLKLLKQIKANRILIQIEI